MKYVRKSHRFNCSVLRVSYLLITVTFISEPPTGASPSTTQLLHGVANCHVPGRSRLLRTGESRRAGKEESRRAREQTSERASEQASKRARALWINRGATGHRRS